MKADIQQIKRALKAGKIEELFKEELGWNKLPEAAPEIPYKGQTYVFKSLVQKAGFKIYQHTFHGHIPEDRFLYQLDKGLNHFAAEHLTVFLDVNRENQVWLWVKRELEDNKLRSKLRLLKFNKQQSGDLLAQKLANLFISLDEEEQGVTLPNVRERVRQGFDVEKVTKTFYGLFKEEHANFLKHIENIPDDDEHKEDREWYTSIMLNRLMFIYFIQKKGLLDNHSSIHLEGDIHYLRKRLRMTQQEHGPDNFYAFYRYFLRRLFHEGFSQPESDHSPELKRIIGNVPYINGGLFDLHLLEQRYPDIQIKDEAFEQVFDFFEGFDWHLDDRPMREDNEINPDVLGYIFEKYINQKQMGAYYTKEDITEYISKNTIIPFIFESVAQHFPGAFVADGPIWSRLQENPDDYIYNALAHGTYKTLPPGIDAGIADVAQRTIWNHPADEQWALPTETWREVVDRRQRYEDMRVKMIGSEICTINDLITYNLNITRFAEDVIIACEDLSLLRAFYDTISQVTVLDPTCGSGAFLFAALNILKPLYQACIKRMDQLVTQYKAQRQENNFTRAFEDILKRIEHRSQEYFILKSIIINNLYGVDIMEEAVEICKLRLFLKLVAQIEKPNDLEPLPDIDFNVLAGNTLIGFTSLDEVRRVVTTKLLNIDNTEEVLRLIERDVQEIERDVQIFRNMQTRLGMTVDSIDIATHKLHLRKNLEMLRGKLDPYLATEYSIYESKYPDKATYENAYAQWQKSHKPFHWWAKFYKIIHNGGFDVIIGNPPYVEYSKVRDQYCVKGYITEKSGNIYNYVMERCSTLLKSSLGEIGVIVPLSGFFTERMSTYQDHIFKQYSRLHLSHFSGDANPSVMFQGVKYRLSIILASRSEIVSEVYSSKYNKWYADERDNLFYTLSYTKNSFQKGYLRFAKIGNATSENVLRKILDKKVPLGSYLRKSGNGHINYHRSPVSWIRAMNFEPYFHSATRQRSLDHLKDLYFVSQKEAEAIGAIINSTCFYYWFIIQGNCRDIAGPDITSFPTGNINDATLTELQGKFNSLMEDYRKHSKPRVYNYATSGRVEYQEFYPKYSKPIIDEIDRVLAQHYGFTPEELDFIINYDIKYRMGRDNGEESEE